VAHWADSAKLCYEVYECAISELFPPSMCYVTLCG